MLRVLIVDDKSEDLYLLEMLLKNNGYDVISAFNGREALEQAERLLPDLVISDILMPVMDGFELCRMWKQNEKFRAIPFIFYTATYIDPKDEQFALSLGADLFLVKPFEPDILLKNISDVLAKCQARTLTNIKENMPANSNLMYEYNEVLIRKLEEKMIQLEEANRVLYVKGFAMDCSVYGIAIAELSGKIIYVNDSFSELFGFDRNKIIGKVLHRIFGNNKVIFDMQKNVNKNGSWLGEVERKKNNGTAILIQIVSNKIIDKTGVPVGIILYCIDMAGLKNQKKK